MSRRTKSEAGAIAVVFAIMVVVLFGLAAAAVDLGNAMNRKKQLQTNADFAALAGGGFLPAPSTTPTTADPEVQAVAKYLYDNVVYDDSGFTPDPSVIAQKIVSNSAADHARYGRVQYGYYHPTGLFVPNPNYVTVTAPSTRVNFGLASAVGFSGVNVGARATAGLKSKGSSALTLPFFAYDGCDWGQQVVSHDTANPSGASFYAPDDNNGVVLTAPTATVHNPNPRQVTRNDTSTVLTLSGVGLTASTAPGDPTMPGITAIGLFLSDGTPPKPVEVDDFVDSTSTTIRFRLPSAVAADDGAVYYVRVQKWTDVSKNSTPDLQLRWSPVTATMPSVEIGSPTLFCNNSKSAGNFGSMSVFRIDSSANEATGWLPLNIALGLHEPYVKLNTYIPKAPAIIDANSCGNGDTIAKPSDEEVSGVLINCAVTNVGFPQNAATNGFLTGVTGTPGAPGRLTKPEAVTRGCRGAGDLSGPELRQVDGKPINNEVLSCFFLDNPVPFTVAEVSSESYSRGVALNPAIFNSPRFFTVPVINSQPAAGKKAFPIVDFRYAFLTGEKGNATKGHGAGDYYWDDATTNGLKLSGSGWNNVKVESFRVVFIHPTAVPPPPGGGTPQEYDGALGQLYLVR